MSFQVPVQNQFVSDYSLADVWAQQTGYAVDLRLGGEWDGADVQHARTLESPQGRTLGGVVVQPPSSERMVQMTRSSYNDVLALWAALLLFVLLAGGWQGYRSAAHPLLDDEDTPLPPRRTSLTLRFFAWAAALGGVRYLLLAIDVPARWQPGASKAPLAPLFDPSHFASTFGWGIARSTGDLLISSLFVALFALAFLDFAARFRVRADSVRQLVDPDLRRMGQSPDRDGPPQMVSRHGCCRAQLP